VTPAVRALEAAGVAFTVHEYAHAAGQCDYGAEAAGALALDPDQVFKTLLLALGAPGSRRSAVDGPVRHAGRSSAFGGRIENGLGYAMAIVPVSAKLSLKAAGATLGVKRAELCDPADAQRITGSVLGGISPFGQRRELAAVIDATCELFDVVYVSGGRRGLDVGVAPGDLLRLLGAAVARITA